MKRLLLFVSALFLLLGLKASDTLTFRQIYQFEVGDTFDYHVLSTVTGNNNGNPTTIFQSESSYLRNVIIDKTTSTDSIAYIVKVFNADSVSWQIDTVLMTSLDSISTDIQSVFYSANHPFPFWNMNRVNHCTLLDSADYIGNLENWDSTYNDIAWSTPAPVWGDSRFQRGLGMTYYHSTNNDGVDPIADIYYTLVYYSKGGSNAGNPYYRISGINELTNDLNCKVYPGITSNQFHLSMINNSRHNIQLTLTDMSGRRIFAKPVTQNENSYDISPLSAGVYIWSIVSENTTLTTGKIIKE